MLYCFLSKMSNFAQYWLLTYVKTVLSVRGYVTSNLTVLHNFRQENFPQFISTTIPYSYMSFFVSCVRRLSPTPAAIGSCWDLDICTLDLSRSLLGIIPVTSRTIATPASVMFAVAVAVVVAVAVPLASMVVLVAVACLRSAPSGWDF